MNRNTAARKIQRRFISKVPLKLSRNTVNEITANALGNIVVQAQNKRGGNVYYMNPSTMNHFLNNMGKFISPRTRNPGFYRFRRAVYVGSTPKKNNMKNVLNKARKTSNKISNQKAGRNLIPNNRIGTTNWAALQWSPPRASGPPVSRYVPSPNWNISPIRRTNNNNANRHNAAVLGRLRQAATRTGARRRLNF